MLLLFFPESEREREREKKKVIYMYDVPHICLCYLILSLTEVTWKHGT